MNSQAIAAAFDAEAAALTAVASELADAELTRPSPCPPWTVAGLLGHVVLGAGRVATALAEPDPGGSRLVSTAAYYRPDERFSVTANAERIDSAVRLAERLGTSAAICAELASACQQTSALLRATPASRAIRTRHGDPMLLTDFARTRVVELGLHGLDLAVALDRQPWLTEPAADVIEALLLPEGLPPGLRDRLRVRRGTLIAGLTGRAELPEAATQALRAAGAVRIALG